MYDQWTQTRRKSGQPWISAVLILAGTLLLASLIIAVWANRQTLDTDSWVSTSDRILRDSEVQSEVSRYIADELFLYTDRRAPAEVRKALGKGQFEQIWSESNRKAHKQLLKALDGDGQSLSANGGQVTLDLNPILIGMSRQLGFGDQVTAAIPPEAARLAILDADEISTVREGVNLIRILPFVLAFLVVFFFGIAIWVAGSSRRYVIGGIGAGFIAAGIICLLVRGAAGPPVADWLTTDDSARLAADAAWSIGTSLLVTISIWSMIFGALIIGGSLLIRPISQGASAR